MAGGVFVKAHPVRIIAVAALLEALSYGQVHVVFRVFMLGHEEAVALFLHEVHAPVFAVEVKHRGAVGLIEYIYVSSLYKPAGQLVPYLAAVLILGAGPQHHRLVFRIGVVVEEGVLHGALAVFLPGYYVEALLGPAAAKAAGYPYAHVLGKSLLPVIVKERKRRGLFPYGIHLLLGGELRLIVGGGLQGVRVGGGVRVKLIAGSVYAGLAVPEIVRICNEGHHRQGVVHAVAPEKIGCGSHVPREISVPEGCGAYDGVFADGKLAAVHL